MIKPKISIITVCFNAGSTILDTVNSVLDQDYPNIEYIIIDGGSTDNTLELLNQYGHNKFHLISEKDEGLYDAINKGIHLATGDVIGLLHADDVYASNGVISKVTEQFIQDSDLEAYSSSVTIYKSQNPNKPYRYYDATKFFKWQFRLGMQPPHPGFFIRKKAFDKVGYYRTQYKISGDFDWLLRAILIQNIKVKYSKEVTVKMKDGGLSSSGIGSKFSLNSENLKILKLHGIYSNKLLIYAKYLFKIFQLRSLFFFNL